MKRQQRNEKAKKTINCEDEMRKAVVLASKKLGHQRRQLKMTKASSYVRHDHQGIKTRKASCEARRGGFF